MNYLLISIIAYFLNSVSVTIDKFLLTEHITAPLVYVVYFSFFSLLALFLLPFTHVPSLDVFLLASCSTILWTGGVFCMFTALKKGASSRVIPLIGTLIPIFLLIQSQFTQSINTNEAWAIIFLVLGIVFLTFFNLKGKISVSELVYLFVAAFLLACSYYLLRQAYLRDNFLTVLVWSRLVLIPLDILLLIVPISRRILIKNHSPNIHPFKRLGWLFLVGQSAGGSSQLLLTFAISLANPALVNSLQGAQYIFLFIFSIVLSKHFPHIFREHFSKKEYVLKVIGILFIGFGLYVLAFARSSNTNPLLGVTYSPKYAQELGLDPKMTFLYVLNDLKVKAIRFPVYWSDVTDGQGNFNFSDVKFYLDEAQRQGVKVILGVGMKQPRWPECFPPKNYQNLNYEQQKQERFSLVEKEIATFKSYPNIVAWQVENEPLLPYGVCPKPDLALLKAEVSLVKKLDTRPIMLTDSGELSNWVDTMQNSDWFGFSLYRIIWDQHFGFIHYPFPSFYYLLKDNLVSSLLFKKPKQFLVSELQAEPWAPERKNIYDLTFAEQEQIFPVKTLDENLTYAKQTHPESIYLWGVEWWYYMKLHGYPEYWNKATEIFKK